jgi:hypothetical protein
MDKTENNDCNVPHFVLETLARTNKKGKAFDVVTLSSASFLFLAFRP